MSCGFIHANQPEKAGAHAYIIGAGMDKQWMKGSESRCLGVLTHILGPAKALPSCILRDRDSSTPKRQTLVLMH